MIRRNPGIALHHAKLCLDSFEPESPVLGLIAEERLKRHPRLCVVDSLVGMV